MKIRTDFVTNSSSSSFVIAYKDVYNNSDSPINCLNNMARTLLDNDSHYETECAEYFNSIEEIESYIKFMFGDSTSIEDILCDYYSNKHSYTIDDLKQFIDNGYTIAIKEVSHHDELVKDLIELMNKTNNYFVVLNDFE